MEWIDIRDQLPTINEYILFYLSDGKQAVAKKPLNHDKHWNYYIVGGWEHCCYCSGESRISLKEVDYDIKNATHWMPLPKPPEE